MVVNAIPCWHTFEDTYLPIQKSVAKQNALIMLLLEKNTEKRSI